MRNSVAEFMSDDVVTVNSQTLLSEALRLIVKSDAAELCVIDDSGRLEGVVTDYELLKASLMGRLGDHTVAGHISRDIVMISPEADLDQIVPLFRDGVCSKAFVCRDGRLLGKLSRATVLRHVAARNGASTQMRPLSLVTTEGPSEAIERRLDQARAPQLCHAPFAAGMATTVMGGVCTALR